MAAVTARTTGDGPRDPDPEEGRLVREAAGGSIAAFEGLYRRYERRIYALCLRMTGSPDQAAITETAHSGLVVPSETIVAPTITLEMPRR